MKYLLIAILTLSIEACATPSQADADDHKADAHHAADEPRPYHADSDAKAELAETLAAAQADDKLSLIVMGANWCHDSRGLAAQFEKPRFQTLIKDHYKLLYIDVGEKNRNIDIAQGFGVDDIVGTPTVFVLSPEREVLNLDTAPSWRNAASRSEGEIYDYFRGFAHPGPN